jgi:hypothetical protein
MKTPKITKAEMQNKESIRANIGEKTKSFSNSF